MISGKLVHEGEVSVTIPSSIAITAAESYKYLGIEQVIEPDHTAVGEQLKKLYVCRLRKSGLRI